MLWKVFLIAPSTRRRFGEGGYGDAAPETAIELQLQTILFQSQRGSPRVFAPPDNATIAFKIAEANGDTTCRNR